ncbi:hypothetical protein ZIOFF_049543 [Zingiber officinale]|uniref:Uncharacterized protein n=1 Tax=Zingiber officinale TaxID=94328 RepID=A0A8J5G1E3_ZINOF|nr:hypothetical protein ZIOFF_049543 [Zingiber officinale]
METVRSRSPLSPAACCSLVKSLSPTVTPFRCAFWSSAKLLWEALVYQYTHKTASGPKCLWLGNEFKGESFDIPIFSDMVAYRSLLGLINLFTTHSSLEAHPVQQIPRNRRTVNRAYGGVLSGGAVRERAEDRQEGAEDPEGERAASLQELSHQ